MEITENGRHDSDLINRTVARVSAEEHIANYRAARALLGKGKEQRKEGRGEKGETKEVTRATACSEK